MPQPASQPRPENQDVASSERRDGGIASPNGRAPDVHGLLRAVDRSAGRHVYAVGSAPPGAAPCELGGLHTSPREGAEPVWLTADGRVVTERHRPDRPRPERATVARWALAPAAWRDQVAAPRRAWELVRRLGQAPRHAVRGPAPARPQGDPVGWLDAERSERSVPLFVAVHPVTGDQLLTIDRWEAIDLGYGEPELLGHLDWQATVMPRLSTRRPDLPWASRLGRHVRTSAERAVPDPPGRIDPVPAPVTVPFRATGWVLTAQAPVATVEVFVDGRHVGRARTGLDRGDVAEGNAHPEAPVCGWEYMVLPKDLAQGATTATVSAVAHDLRGTSVELGEVRYGLAVRPDLDDRPRIAQVRERGRRVARGARPRALPGLNLLVFTHELGLGGAQLYLAEILIRLSFRKDAAITVVAPADGPLRRQLEEHGIAVHLTNAYTTDDSERYEYRLAELAAWAAPQGFDVVFANTMIAFPGVDVAGLLGLPSVFAIHESFELDAYWREAHPAHDVPRHIRERGAAALAGASAVIFEAQATRDQWAVHGDPDRFLARPYAIELPRVDAFRKSFDPAAARRELRLPEHATVILCLGTVEARKAQSPLAIAFGQVSDRHPNALLALVGAVDDAWRGSYLAGLIHHVERSGLSSRIVVRGIDADPFQWHGVADLLVCASDVESLPRVVLESMAFDTPVLASSVFGLPEVIEDGRNGWLCEPRDVASLSSALDRALSASAEERAAIGMAGGRTVRERHEPEGYFARLVALLEGLADDPQADPAALMAP